MNQKTILCFGDSNTWGYDPVNACRFSRQIRWPGILQKQLGPHYEVIEEGLCGRTTVWDDPVEGHKNGLKQLIPILHSHCPLDLVIMMLGTNDLKNRFSVSALDIACGVGRLVDAVRNSETNFTGPAPQVLVLCPPPLNTVCEAFRDVFIGAREKSRGLAQAFSNYCGQNGIDMLDAGQVLSISDADGVHFQEPDHLKLGIAVAIKVKKMLENT